LPIQNLEARAQQLGKDFIDSAESVKQSLTSAVNITAGNALTTGATAALGAVNNLAGNLTGAIGSEINNAIGGALGGLLGGVLGGAIGGAPSFPKENVLSKYASYNCVFTLGVLTASEVNNPESTYRRSGPSILILRSGGTGSKQVRTQLEMQANTTGEYFIDDVEIDTLIAPNPKTKQTNATKIEFKVSEPYSMGLFLQTLMLAALKGGWKNYLEAPYLLQVEFIGWDDNGKPLNVPRSKRMFPLKFANVEFNVTAGGSEYSVTAIPWHEAAFSNEVQGVKTDVNIKGSTILELLQTGPESLATILNNRELEQVSAGNKKIGDQYVFLFPANKGDAENAIKGSSRSTGGATTQSVPPDDITQVRELSNEKKSELYQSLTGIQNGQVPADFDAELSKLLGIVVKRSKLGESIREYAEKEENVNNIGKSKIVKSYLDSGKPYFGKPAFTKGKDKTTNGTIFTRGAITISDEGRAIQFKQGARVQDIVEEIILLSDYGRKFISEVPNGIGMKTWFRIEANNYVIADSTNVTKTGESAKIYVYKIVPYQVHASRISSPTQATPAIPVLKSQVMREYNYIYTGKNDDIINFNIDINAAFFSAIQGDYGQLGKSAKLGGSDSKVAPEESPKHGQADGNSQAVPGAGIAPSKLVNSSNTGNLGGGAMSHPETQVARSFNDAIVNSPVDLVSAGMEIWGDPYYIADSGMGNYDAPEAAFNVTSDNAMEYQTGEVDILINFRTPVDYGPDGQMKFPGGGTRAVGAFSGLYQVTMVKNKFSGNKFTQELTTIRRRNQEVPGGVDVGLESIIEKGLDAIISPLAAAPAAAFAGAMDELTKSIGGIGGISGLADSIQGSIDGAIGGLTAGIPKIPDIGAVATSGLNQLQGQVSSAAAGASDALKASLKGRI
tara:strand:- start:41923 stop:44622 length:2700 start_codon:yes stop_codon:yes gene_type:complete